MSGETKVEGALKQLVEAVKSELTIPAVTLTAIADGLEQLGDAMGPVDLRVAQEARGTAASLRQHSADLRKAAEGYSSKMLPGDTPVVPLAVVRESA